MLSDSFLKDILKIMIRGGIKKSNGPGPNWSWQKAKEIPGHFQKSVMLRYYLKGLEDGGRENVREVYAKAEEEVREEFKLKEDSNEENN